MAGINTNIIALETQNSLRETQSSLATSIRRLSSGLKISSAQDDPAGLAIASRMKSQLSGLTQASSNASEGISMLQTADGGLAGTTKLLQSMRGLAVQAANGTNSPTDLASIQAEITQLQAQIQQVATQTQYNGINLLDGSLSNLQFQVGANAGQTISFGISNAQQTALGNNLVSMNDGATSMTQASAAAVAGASKNIAAAQSLTVQGNAAVPNIAVTANESASAIAAAFNQSTSTTGITATASTTAALTFGAAGLQSFTLNGQQISASFSADYTSAANAINQQTGKTGVTATINSGGTGLTLSNTTGADIKVLNSGANAMTLTGTTGAGAAGTAITLAAAASGSLSESTVGGSLSFSSQSGFAITSSIATGGLFSASTANGSLLQTVGAINLTTLSASGAPVGANAALSIIDAAIAQVNTSRGLLGALQNRFTATVSNLDTAALNLSSSLSTVQDTDFASETTNLSTTQILQQAGTAMLAQANQLPSGVLALLR